MKQSASNIGKANQRSYKPLIPPRLQKTSSSKLKDDSNFVEENERVKVKKQRK